MRWTASLLSLASLLYQFGACCAPGGRGAQWFGVTLREPGEAGIVEHCAGCLGHGHESPESDGTESDGPDSMHLCIGTHVFYLTASSVTVPDDRERQGPSFLAPRSVVGLIGQLQLDGGFRLEQGASTASIAPLRAELQIFQI